MARWALGMLIISGLATVLTAAGVWMIYGTLKHTETMARDTTETAKHAAAAVVEAQRGNQAAQESINVTRDIGEAQISAYISIASVEIRVGDDSVEVRASVINTGNSAARLVEIQVQPRIKIISMQMFHNMSNSHRFCRELAANDKDITTHHFDFGDTYKPWAGMKPQILEVIVLVGYENILRKPLNETYIFWRPVFSKGDAFERVDPRPAMFGGNDPEN